MATRVARPLTLTEAMRLAEHRWPKAPAPVSPASDKRRARPAINRTRLGFATAMLLRGAAAQGQTIEDYFPDGVPGANDDTGVTVLSRRRPAFDPEGVREGAALLRPSLDETVGVDDNPQSATHARAAELVVTKPELTGLWDSDTLRAGFDVAVVDTRLLGFPGQDRDDLAASVGAALDLDGGRVVMAYTHLAQHQPLTGLDALPADRPIAYAADDLRASYGWDAGPWTLTADLGATSLRFAEATLDGRPLAQGYRDRAVARAGFTARYNVAEDRAVIGVVRADAVDYEHGLTGAPSRDSRTVAVLAGAADDSDAVWRWRVLAGLEARWYVAPEYRAHVAPTAEARLIYAPSGLTNVTATVRRLIEDADQEGVASYDYTDARIVLDHEYLRNLLFQLRAEAQVAQYGQGGGTQTSETAGAGMTWMPNRVMHVLLNYDHTEVQGGRGIIRALTGDYGRDVATITVRLAL